MNRILALIFFAGALYWTWTLIHSSSDVGVEVHAGLQKELAGLIQNVLEKKRPRASQFQLQKIYTETIDKNKVKANFAYSYQEKSDRSDTWNQKVEGTAVLYKQPSPDPNVSRWIVQEVKTVTDQVEFQEGSTISPNKKDPEEDVD